MAAPPNSWQHLLSVYMSIHNKMVKREFTDLPSDTEEQLEDFSVARSSIRTGCLIKIGDSAVIVILRLFLFYVIVRKARDFHPPIYGMPSQEIYETFDSKGLNYPQIILHFAETRYDAATNQRMPATAQISVRWRETNISTAELRALATKIKSIFATPPYKWQKGREIYTYYDRSKGYYFQVYAYSETEAKNVIGKVWEIQDTGVPDWENRLRKHTDDKNWNFQQTFTILGEIRKKPKRRPIATVEFTHAEVNIPGLLDSVILIDLTGTYPGAIEYL